jgi:hypothetical protein
MNSMAIQPSTSEYFKKELSHSQQKKSFELQVALFIAVKTSFNSAGDLSVILQRQFGRDAIQLGRTKCMALTKSVLAPYFQQDLKEDLQDTPFSLMVDETTDISVTKLVAASIRFFSRKQKKIVTTYLGMTEIAKADAVGLDGSVRQLMETWNLQGEDLVGLGTDGANVMKGQHHSLLSLIRVSWPHVVHLQCVCHALDLAAKETVRKTMPSNLEHMIRETYNWFSVSSLRQLQYKEILDLVGFSTSVDDEDEDEMWNDQVAELQPVKKPLKILSPSNTRWLILSECIERILLQYDALKAHFDVAYQNEHCYGAKSLREMFKDERNRLFLLFFTSSFEGT